MMKKFMTLFLCFCIFSLLTLILVPMVCVTIDSVVTATKNVNNLSEISQLKEDINSLSININLLNDTKIEVTSQMDSIVIKISEIDKNIEVIEQELDNSNSTNDELREELEYLQQSRIELENDYASLQTQLSSIEQTISSNYTELNEKITQLSNNKLNITDIDLSLCAYGQMLPDVLNNVIGRLYYHKIGSNSGVLSGTISIPANNLDTTFKLADLARISTLLNVELKTPSTPYITGTWWLINNVDDSLTGYGTAISVSDILDFGRYYTTSGSFGGWSLATFSGCTIAFDNVYVEEI